MFPVACCVVSTDRANWQTFGQGSPTGEAQGLCALSLPIQGTGFELLCKAKLKILAAPAV